MLSQNFSYPNFVCIEGRELTDELVCLINGLGKLGENVILLRCDTLNIESIINNYLMHREK
jgi:hypothetical protein